MNANATTLLFLIIGVSVFQAQKTKIFSQQKAIELGLKNNLQVQIANLEKQQSQELTKSGWELPKMEFMMFLKQQ